MDWWIFVYFRDNYGFVTFAYTCDAYAAIESKYLILDLKVPITKIVLFCCLLKCFSNLFDKQCKLRSDCFCRSSLIWVHIVCSYSLIR